jgi:hypothetical protein
LTIFANTTQRKLQFVTRIQLSKNKRSLEIRSTLRLTKKISER